MRLNKLLVATGLPIATQGVPTALVQVPPHAASVVRKWRPPHHVWPTAGPPRANNWPAPPRSKTGSAMLSANRAHPGWEAVLVMGLACRKASTKPGCPIGVPNTRTSYVCPSSQIITSGRGRHGHLRRIWALVHNASDRGHRKSSGFVLVGRCSRCHQKSERELMSWKDCDTASRVP